MLAARQSLTLRSRSIAFQRKDTAASSPALATRGKRRFITSAALSPLAPQHPSSEDAEGSFNGPSAHADKWTMSGGSSGGATMERHGPINFIMPTPTRQAPKLDDGGSGGENGRHNRNGGGGDGGGNNDDDDFFNDEEGDGEGEGNGYGSEGGLFATLAIAESYDKLSIAAVFAEWMRTVADLPMIIRRAVEMGLFSSAQLVRFFSMDVRPSVARSVTRNLPPSWAREFVGRMMADPAFAQKLAIESILAASASLFYEWRVRGDNFSKELDLAAINTLGLTGATAATVWLLAPTRSYGTLGNKFPFQQMLAGLPNCVFDVSGPLRQYTGQARIGSLFAKAAELSAVGAAAGAFTSLASSAVVELRRQSTPFGPGDASFQPSVPIPELNRSSAGLGAFFALNANLRYQAIGGLDRFLFGHANFLWTYLGLSGATRLASMTLGEMSRPWWQGLPDVPASHKRVVTRRVSKKVARKVPKSSLVVAGAEVEGVAAVSEAEQAFAASSRDREYVSLSTSGSAMMEAASLSASSLASEVSQAVAEAAQLAQPQMGGGSIGGGGGAISRIQPA